MTSRRVALAIGALFSRGFPRGRMRQDAMTTTCRGKEWKLICWQRAAVVKLKEFGGGYFTLLLLSNLVFFNLVSSRNCVTFPAANSTENYDVQILNFFR